MDAAKLRISRHARREETALTSTSSVQPPIKAPPVPPPRRSSGSTRQPSTPPDPPKARMERRIAASRTEAHLTCLNLLHLHPVWRVRSGWIKEQLPVQLDTVDTVIAMINQPITEWIHTPLMLNMCQDAPCLGRDGFKSMMALGWI